VATATNAACSDSLISQIFKGNAITCSDTFKDYLVGQEKDSIQSVVDNAATYYGEDSTTVHVAQTAASQQEAQAENDVKQITDDVAASNFGQIFTTCDDGNGGLAIPGLPCINYTYLLYGGIALVVLYFVAIIASFVPRPR
jgi:hypothetical protein